MSLLARQRLTLGGIALLYAGFAALWILTSDGLLGLVIDDPAVLVRLSMIKGVAFVVATAGFLYLLLRGWRESLLGARPDEPEAARAPRGRWLVLVLAGLAATPPLLGFGIAHVHGPQIEREAYANLQAIADLKADQIEFWLAERWRDGEVLAADAGFVRQVDQFLRQNDATSRQEILSRLGGLQAHGYDGAMLLDGQDQPVLSLGDRVAIFSDLQSLLSQARASGQIQRGDITLDPFGIIHLDWVIPLTLSDPEGPHLGAMVVLRAELRHFLFPLIQRWPTASPSAESLLVRREGRFVVFLNELRHHSGAPLTQHALLDTVDLPAAVAVRAGRAGIVRGIDYRGAPVLAAFRPVAGTDWHLVAKIDRAEVLAPLNRLVFWVGGVALCAVAAVTAAVLLLWRQQQRAHRFELLAQAAQQDRLLRKFYDLPFVGMAFTSPETKRWLQFNDRLCAILGYPREELANLSWAEITHPDDLTADVGEFERVLRGESDGYVMDKRFIRKDGAVVFATIDVKCLRRADGTVEVFIATIDDITERKPVEIALRESEAFTIGVLDALTAHIAVLDPHGTIVAVNRAWRRFAADSDAPESLVKALGANYLAVCEAAPGGDRGEEAEAARTGIHAVLSGARDRFGLEYPCHSPDRQRWFNINVSPLPAPHAGVVIAHEDITERKQAEERLRQAAAVFENTSEGIVITDADERILRVNRAFRELTGYTEEEVLGQTPRLLRSGRQDSAFYAAMWSDLQETGHWQGEVWNQRKDGRVYPGLLSISAVRDAAGVATHYVGVCADLSRIKASEERLDFLAHHDALTGLPNRLLFSVRLQHGIDIARRDGSLLALLALDLDRFKDVNDSYGHAAGDELLRQAAERLTRRLRGADTVTRLSGDEFAVLLEDLPQPQDAARVAQDLIGILSEPWRLANNVEARLGASLGISLFPDHGQTAESLLQQADAALYQAKNEGRGCFQYFSAELTQAARRRLELEARLRHAIHAGQLRAYYQPQVDIPGGRIIGAEALVRWQDPDHGLIPPGRFIPLAEETGLIGAIGEWMLRETCRQGRAWREAGLPSLTLAVNLSAQQIQRGDLAATVLQVLSETGFPADHLELELTESALMRREAEAVAILERLRGLGVRLAMDDFGTGYSSLAYLKRFPLDVLKIDKSFVDDLPRQRNAMEIVATIIAMGHALGLKVLAEGVETSEQLTFLRIKGCHLYQGYLTSPPVPAENFAALLARAATGR